MFSKNTFEIELFFFYTVLASVYNKVIQFIHTHTHIYTLSFIQPFWCLVSIESTCIAGDTGDADLIPGSGRSSGGGNGTPLHYSSLKIIMDREAWQATVHGVAKSWTWQATHSFLHICMCVCVCYVLFHYKILSTSHMLYLLVKFMKKYAIFSVLNAGLITYSQI